MSSQGLGADALARVKVTLVVSFAALSSIALLALTIWYWKEAGSVKETLVFFLAGAAAVGQVTASFYTARVLNATLVKDQRDAEREAAAERRDAEREAAAQRRETALDERAKADADLAMKRATFRFAERWNDASMFHARDILRALTEPGQSDQDRKKYIEEHRTNFIHVMNFLEEIATAYKYGLIDKTLIKVQFDHVVVYTWELTFSWVFEHRRERVSTVWEDLESLYREWKRP